jgi:hypothetical protein
VTTLPLNDGRPITLEHASVVPNNELASFYDKAFPRRANTLKQHWQWLYKGGRALDHSNWPLLAIDSDGSILGHASTIPVYLLLHDRLIPAVWFVDYFVLPRARRLGLGDILLKEVMNAAPAVIAINASSNSIPIFLKHYWKKTESAIINTLLLSPSQHPRFRNTPLRLPLRPIDFLIKHFYNYRSVGKQKQFVVSKLTRSDYRYFMEHPRKHDRIALSVLHDPDFLDWRITECPIRDRYFLHQSSKSYALTRVTDASGYRQLKILISNVSSDNNLFGHITNWAISNDIDEITVVTSDNESHRLARNWFPQHKNIPDFFYSGSRKLMDDASVAAHQWELIDSDLDLVQVDD